jgi:hypothetical protein
MQNLYRNAVRMVSEMFTLSIQTTVLCVEFKFDGFAVTDTFTPLTTRSSTRAATDGQTAEQLIAAIHAPPAPEIVEAFTPVTPPLTRAATAAAADEHASKKRRKLTAPRSEKFKLTCIAKE